MEPILPLFTPGLGFDPNQSKYGCFLRRKYDSSFVNCYKSAVDKGNFAIHGSKSFPVFSDFAFCISVPKDNGYVTWKPLFTCHALENGSTLIPHGVYELQLTYSPKFKKLLPILLDVPKRDGIRIHAGNYCTDSSGCILLGNQISENLGMVMVSTPAVDGLIEHLRDALKVCRPFIHIYS